MPRLLLLAALLSTALAAHAVPSLIDPVADGVWVVHDDQNQWGTFTDGMGITHQNLAPYQAKKILDTSQFPEATWDTIQEVRVSLYFLLRDYSWHDQPKANGLDETFQIVVNGTVHQYPTKDNGPVYAEHGSQPIEWYDFPIPKTELRRGPNEIIIRKGPGAKGDDYLYLGIDNSLKRGNSSVSFADDKWTQERLTIPGGNGEYLVRLYLFARSSTVTASWTPAAATPLADPTHLIAYAGARQGETQAAALNLAAGQPARLEWDSHDLDRLAPLKATIQATGDVKVAWLNARDEPYGATTQHGAGTVALPAKRPENPTGLLLTAVGPVALQQVTIDGERSYHPRLPAIDQAPRLTPAVEAKATPPSCRLSGDTATLANGRLTAKFSGGRHLRLTSLRHESLGAELVRDPAATWFFLVEVDGQRYAGSRDFELAGWTARPGGFEARLRLPDPALTAALTVRMEAEGLRWGLTLTNAGAKPVDFKLAFPHVAGLTVSEQAADDYYFYPSGGGIIADTPALIRRGYGDYEAMYQVLDVFSPARGGGLMLRADDREGWHKVLALRKFVPGRGTHNEELNYQQVRPEYRWKNPLDEVAGTAFAVEYQRRTRPPGGSFAPADGVLAAHTGDWHTALAAYAAWAHRVWKYRPLGGRLKTVHNMDAPGWAQNILFKNGAYRTDLVHPRVDCVELMSWWDWSPNGPFNTPFDQLAKVLTPAQIKMWEPYFVKDPVTGQKMWNNQPGDYAGYNDRFGGLPAFRKCIETCRQQGALVTLYTDPFRFDGSCPLGKLHGEEWGVVGENGQKTTAYEVWNPCHDLPEVRQWVGQAMERVMRETGADGLRLDEYGHRGWACYDPKHHHTYAESGITQWNKAVSDATRQVREGLDRVDPKLVLTTEHPGYDYLLQYLDGCITYDMSSHRSALRPVELNAQRFYFPECKAYEYLNADPLDRRKFWNAVEVFGRPYLDPYYAVIRENEDVYQSGDAQPLVPTRAARVYANLFRGAGKTLIHLYNSTGHTYQGVVFEWRVRPGQHVVDLLTGREAETIQSMGGPWRLVAYLPREEVACLAVLNRVLTVKRVGSQVSVAVGANQAGRRLAVCDAKGARLLETDAAATQTIDLTKLPAGSQPVCVKLLAAGQLVDVRELPAPAQG